MMVQKTGGMSAKIEKAFDKTEQKRRTL